MNTHMLDNHYRLLLIVEAYAHIYKEDIQNTFLDKEITGAMRDAKEIQRKRTTFFRVFPR